MLDLPLARPPSASGARAGALSFSIWRLLVNRNIIPNHVPRTTIEEIHANTEIATTIHSGGLHPICSLGDILWSFERKKPGRACARRKPSFHGGRAEGARRRTQVGSRSHRDSGWIVRHCARSGSLV